MALNIVASYGTLYTLSVLIFVCVYLCVLIKFCEFCKWQVFKNLASTYFCEWKVFENFKFINFSPKEKRTRK